MSASKQAVDWARVAARAGWEKKGEQIVGIDVSSRLPFADAFVLIAADNERMVASIGEAVEEELHKIGAQAKRREGLTGQRWILLDFGDLIVHVQHHEDRVYYALEKLWGDCPSIDLELPEGESAAS